MRKYKKYTTIQLRDTLMKYMKTSCSKADIYTNNLVLLVRAWYLLMYVFISASL